MSSTNQAAEPVKSFNHANIVLYAVVLHCRVTLVDQIVGTVLLLRLCLLRNDARWHRSDTRYNIS